VVVVEVVLVGGWCSEAGDGKEMGLEGGGSEGDLGAWLGCGGMLTNAEEQEEMWQNFNATAQHHG